MTKSDDSILLDAFLDISPDGVLLSDERGCIQGANAAAGAILRCNPGDLIGKPIDAYVPDPSLYATERSEPGRAKPHRSTPVEGKRTDDSAVPLMQTVGRVDTTGGTVFISILHDLTSRHAMEKATARSQRMDAIGRMTGGIAHDFNNLLTVIIGNLELLEAAELTERQRGLLSDALIAAEMGADLTSRLTIFARKSTLKPAPLDLNTQVARSLSLLNHTIGRHCRISSKAQPDLWLIEVDPTQLQTAILNIAMNSQDAMPNGGEIFLETHNIEIDSTYMAQELNVAPGRYARLAISDTGLGMRPEERAHALEPFFTTKPASHGTGLGLSMVYGFVKQSGGHVTIYSEPGEGTMIALYFPAVEQDIPTGTGQMEGPKRTAMPPMHGSVLIVEDDAKLRQLTETRLRALGFACLATANADEAWELVSDRNDIALVFTDMVMPGKLSGYDLATRLAAERPDIAVLLTSGFSETVLRDRWIGEEFRILRKPYRQADLAESVYAVLGIDEDNS